MSKCWILTVLGLCAFNAAAIEPQGFAFKVKQVDRKDDNPGYQLEVLKNGRVIKTIDCQSSVDSTRPCYAVPLSTGGFVLVDSVHRDGIMEDGLFIKYDEHGQQDPRFVTVFPVNYNEMLNSPKGINGIKAIEKLAENPNDNRLLDVTGAFQVEELDGLSFVERNMCVGEEDCDAGIGGRSTRAKLTFDMTGKIVAKEIISRPAFPYSKQQVRQELERRIAREEEDLKKGAVHPLMTKAILEEAKETLAKLK